ncbi:hypothetical protein [Sorangium sp. So ce1182]|uniref:hypothetical protein n=1 Tax=Sorangium sp. So ce1182 TaxID=3133334 RepID=UPI003F5EC9E8
MISRINACLGVAIIAGIVGGCAVSSDIDEGDTGAPAGESVAAGEPDSREEVSTAPADGPESTSEAAEIAEAQSELVIDPCADINYENLIDCRSGVCYCFRRVGTEYRWCNWWWRSVSIWETYVCN